MMVGVFGRFEEPPDSAQKRAEPCTQLEALRGRSLDRCFDQPDLLGLPDKIFMLFARDLIAYYWVEHSVSSNLRP
jgi:hypothetical protein